MIEAHKRLIEFLEQNKYAIPQDVSIAVISHDPSDNTISSSVRGNVHDANVSIALKELVKRLDSNNPPYAKNI